MEVLIVKVANKILGDKDLQMFVDSQIHYRNFLGLKQGHREEKEQKEESTQ